MNKWSITRPQLMNPKNMLYNIHLSIQKLYICIFYLYNILLYRNLTYSIVII